MAESLYPEWEWEIAKGDDNVLTCDYENDDGSIEPLTDCDIEVTIWDRPEGRLLLKLTSDPAAGVVITEATGRFVISVADAQSAAFDFQHGYYFVKVRDSGSLVKTLFRGPVLVVPAPVWGVTA